MKYAIVPVTPFQQNCTVMWCPETKAGAVVDPGGDLDRVMQVVMQEELKIEKILVTHGHLDHAGATLDLAEGLGVPIEGPNEADKFWIDGMPAAAENYGFPPSRAFTPNRWLEHGDTVTLGNHEIEVLHCPGHTPGHVVFFHRPSMVANVGDVLFQGSIGRTDFPKGDYGALIHSIRDRLFPLGDDVTFIPGHGPTSTFGQERRTNPFVADGVA